MGAWFSMWLKVAAPTVAVLMMSSESKWTPTLKGVLKEQSVAGLALAAESSRLQIVPQILLTSETTIAAPSPVWRLGMSR